MSDPGRLKIWHSYKSAFFKYLCTGEAETARGKCRRKNARSRVRSILLRSEDFSAVVEFMHTIHQSDTLRLT